MHKKLNTQPNFSPPQTDSKLKMSSSSNSSASDGIDWLDIEPDEETITYVSFFGPETFSSLNLLLDHSKDSHGFDLRAVIQQLGLDFHGAVKLVNFVRTSVRDGQPVPDTFSTSTFSDDKYLLPVLENDAVIFSLDEILENDNDSAAPVPGKGESSSETVEHNKQLQSELASLKEQFANYRLAVEKTLDNRWGDDIVPAKESTKDNSDYYFESYASNEIHETMLKDQVRTDAYRDFIYENKNAFAGKTVLDIGCGTGILSMFCAKAGAAHVIAVDKSDIIEKARENVFNNGLSDKITCLRGAIEDVKLPVDKVDIIVSEWMGYCLLYEAMLPSVLYARDHYLKEGGIMAPSSATLWVAPIEDSLYISDYITYWRDVYGFDMKAMQEGIFDDVRIQTMPSASICGKPFPFKCLDLYTVKPEDLFFSASWTSQISRPVDSLDGFLVWFDNFFAASPTDPIPEAQATPDTWKHKPGDIAFTTGPFGKETHWKQGLLLLPPSDSSPLTADSTISGTIKFETIDSNTRAVKLGVDWATGSETPKCRAWDLK